MFLVWKETLCWQGGTWRTCKTSNLCCCLTVLVVVCGKCSTATCSSGMGYGWALKNTKITDIHGLFKAFCHENLPAGLSACCPCELQLLQHRMMLEPQSKTRSVLVGREVPADKQVLVGVVCFVSFQDQLYWVRKRKAKKIKLGDEWSMACYELCTHTNPWGGLAVPFLKKRELPKHSNVILFTGGS